MKTYLFLINNVLIRLCNTSSDRKVFIYEIIRYVYIGIMRLQCHFICTNGTLEIVLWKDVDNLDIKVDLVDDKIARSIHVNEGGVSVATTTPKIGPDIAIFWLFEWHEWRDKQLYDM